MYGKNDGNENNRILRAFQNMRCSRTGEYWNVNKQYNCSSQVKLYALCTFLQHHRTWLLKSWITESKIAKNNKKNSMFGPLLVLNESSGTWNMCFVASFRLYFDFIVCFYLFLIFLRCARERGANFLWTEIDITFIIRRENFHFVFWCWRVCEV